MMLTYLVYILLFCSMHIYRYIQSETLFNFEELILKAVICPVLGH